MSVDKLQERIRKLKNPSVIDFGIKPDAIPAHLLREEGCAVGAYRRFCLELMEALREIVPAVRFSFSTFALMGAKGLAALNALLLKADEMGYYTFLDSPEFHSPWGADRAADGILGEEGYLCDGIIISPYIGSDALKPFLPYCKNCGKDLFVIVRSANRSASELQDLRTGTRLVQDATAEMVNRFGDPIRDKCGYSRICAVTSAGNPEGVRNLRSRFNRMYLLVDGLDYPSGNAKNCSFAFDRFGHGAVVCAGPSVTAAWAEGESGGEDYICCAVAVAERMKKNLNRYISIL